jgi:hypothetical protein
MALRRLCSHRGTGGAFISQRRGGARCLKPARIPVVNIEHKLGQPVGVMLAGFAKATILEAPVEFRP